MKVFFFHLMPYADVDLAEVRKTGTAWVKLPNRLYDPEKGAALYERHLNELERAEELGFDGIGVNEHHQTAYGLMPSPIVMASALARRTHRVKICILGSAIAEAKPHFENFRNCFARMPIEFLLPPGYTSRASMKRVAAAKKYMFGDLEIEPAIEMGMMVCGSAATVRDRMIRYYGDMGFGNLIALLQFGTLPAELTEASTNRFAADVMPALQALGERPLEQRRVA